MDLVRLACVRHAASVRPEPGSNSPSRSQVLHRGGGPSIGLKSRQIPGAVKVPFFADWHQNSQQYCCPFQVHSFLNGCATLRGEPGSRPHSLFVLSSVFKERRLPRWGQRSTGSRSLSGAVVPGWPFRWRLGGAEASVGRRDNLSADPGKCQLPGRRSTHRPALLPLAQQHPAAVRAASAAPSRRSAAAFSPFTDTPPCSSWRRASPCDERQPGPQQHGAERRRRRARASPGVERGRPAPREPPRPARPATPAGDRPPKRIVAGLLGGLARRRRRGPASVTSRARRPLGDAAGRGRRRAPPRARRSRPSGAA